jgi:hypothetical protein
MTYTFRKAIRENTTCLVAFAGESGSGKTFSGLRFARGLVGPAGKLALLDTEAGRALHYADRFDFDHLDLKPPFSPIAYTEAIVAAEEAGYKAIIIDSMSLEWSGEGGCVDMHDDALHRMAGDDAAKAERMSVLAWRDAKMAHKRMMSRLLQCRAHLIFCLRSEEKIKFIKVDGKQRIEPAGWVPICEKNFMFEQTVSFMLHSDHPGYGIPMKLQEQHKPFFKHDAPLDEDAGKLLAAWAAGATEKKATAQNGEYVTKEQILEIESLMEMAGLDKQRMLRVSGIHTIDKLLASNFNRVLEWISKVSKAKP